MTSLFSHAGHSRTRRRFARTLTAALTASVIVLTPLAGQVSAAPDTPVATPVDLPADPHVRSSSPVVAERATQALALLGHYVETETPTSYTDYLRLLDEVARLSAAELGLDGDEMSSAWFEAPRPKQVALLAALTQLGVPYRRMASSEGVGFDCSGLVAYAWGRAGVQLPRSSREQITVGPRIDLASAEAGDFVYYPGHIMMYLGVSTAIVHSPNSGNHVEIRFASHRRLDSLIVVDPLPEPPVTAAVEPLPVVAATAEPAPRSMSSVGALPAR